MELPRNMWSLPVKLPLSVSGTGERAFITLSITTVLCLLTALTLMIVAQEHMKNANTALETAITLKESALSHKALIERKIAHAREASALVSKAEGYGYSAQKWAERRFAMRRVTVSREDFNQILLQTQRSKDQVFGADEFEVAVATLDQSVFERPVSGTGEILLTLVGTSYFRVGDAQ